MIQSGTEQRPLVSLRSVSKRFRGQLALKDIDLDIMPGTVHALVGENGAGKSTLGRIVAGLHQPTEGVVQVDGSPVRYRTPAAALRDGITMIAQEIALAPHLTAVENVMLGFEKSRGGVMSRGAMRRRFDDLLARTGFEIEPEVRVSNLPLAKQQEVEILRALARGARLIVMDEPTAALGAADAEKMREYVGRLQSDGVTVVYVSHFLSEVLEVATEITVLRNGELVESMPRSEATVDRMIGAMLGGKLEAVYPEKRPPAQDSPSALRVEGVVTRDDRPPISIELKRGEIVGLFGLMGAGRTTLAHCLFGARRPSAGEISILDQPFDPRRPRNALDRGLVLLPESRRDAGLFLTLSQLANTCSAGLEDFTRGGVIRRRELRRSAKEMLAAVDVDPISLTGEVGKLSGGNQQKVLFSKCLLPGPTVLLLDEPTRGVDVGSKQSIYRLIADLAARGAAILCISSELEEVTQLCHRVLVMKAGEISGEFAEDSINPDEVLAAAFGHYYAEAAA